MSRVASIVGGCLLLANAACSPSRPATEAPRSTVTTAFVPPTTAGTVTTSASSVPPATTSTSSVPATSSTSTTTTPTPISTKTAAAPAAAIRITKGTNGRPVVALTFDAGADRGNAERILDILAANHVRASFGVTGRWAEQNPDLFRRMAADHQIINHTYDHRSWTGLSTHAPPLTDTERLAEVQRADEVYKRLAGITAAPFFRFPFGDLDKKGDQLLASAGYRYDVLYTTDSRGWQGAEPAAIVHNCRAGDFAGAIVVMHVGSRSRDVEALQQVIDDVRSAGLTPGSLTDLI